MENYLPFLILGTFLIIYTLGSGYIAYLFWFKFEKFKEILLKRGEAYENNNFFAQWGYIWIEHPSYKWFGRILALLMSIIGVIALLALTNELI